MKTHNEWYDYFGGGGDYEEETRKIRCVQHDALEAAALLAEQLQTVGPGDMTPSIADAIRSLAGHLPIINEGRCETHVIVDGQ